MFVISKWNHQQSFTFSDFIQINAHLYYRTQFYAIILHQSIILHQIGAE